MTCMPSTWELFIERRGEAEGQRGSAVLGNQQCLTVPGSAAHILLTHLVPCCCAVNMQLQ